MPKQSHLILLPSFTIIVNCSRFPKRLLEQFDDKEDQHQIGVIEVVNCGFPREGSTHIKADFRIQHELNRTGPI